jgi:hypothetical protein
MNDFLALLISKAVSAWGVSASAVVIGPNRAAKLSTPFVVITFDEDSRTPFAGGFDYSIPSVEVWYHGELTGEGDRAKSAMIESFAAAFTVQETASYGIEEFAGIIDADWDEAPRESTAVLGVRFSASFSEC